MSASMSGYTPPSGSELLCSSWGQAGVVGGVTSPYVGAQRSGNCMVTPKSTGSSALSPFSFRTTLERDLSGF